MTLITYIKVNVIGTGSLHLNIYYLHILFARMKTVLSCREETHEWIKLSLQYVRNLRWSVWRPIKSVWLVPIRAILDSILFPTVDRRIKKTIESFARNGGRVAHVLSVYMFAIRWDLSSCFFFHSFPFLWLRFITNVREKSPPTAQRVVR